MICSRSHLFAVPHVGKLHAAHNSDPVGIMCSNQSASLFSLYPYELGLAIVLVAPCCFASVWMFVLPFDAPFPNSRESLRIGLTFFVTHSHTGFYGDRISVKT
jgi:hypothetical protein